MRLSLCFLFVFSYALIAQKQMFELPEWRLSNLTTADAGQSDKVASSQQVFFSTTDTEIDTTICPGQEYIFDGDTLTTTGQYQAVFTDVNGGDSTVTLNLTVLPTIAPTNLAVTLCSGQSYLLGGDTLSSSGFYLAILTSAAGCDSMVNVTLTVLPPPIYNYQAAICSNEFYLFGNDTLTQQGLYQGLFTNSSGCDSMVVLTLTVFPPTPLTEVETSICSGEAYLFEGEEYTESGFYQVTYSNAVGCDSTLTLNLTVLPDLGETINLTICEESAYDFYGETLTEAGVYTKVFQGANGCDSTITLNLTVREPDLTLLEESFCAGQSYLFNGENLTAPGAYTALLTDSDGCDSLIILNLSLLQSSNTALAGVLCEGETYDFNGQVLTAPGVYTAMLTGANGCDSTVVLTLIQLEPDLTLLEESFCAGQSYLFNNENLTAPGEYTALLTNVNGCDSLVILNLTQLPVSSTTLEVTLCEEESYDFNGQTLTESGVYVDVLTGANGCDSTVALTLTVLEPDLTLLEESFCAGQSYLFNGENLTAPGEYTALLTNVNGCDSLVILSLSLFPVTSTAIEATLCEGGEYDFNGQILTESGVYVDVQTGVNGCDSTIVLTLNIDEPDLTLLEESICEGQSYAFNGEDLTAPGSYMALFTNVNGCDSLVILDLAVIPASVSVNVVSICSNEVYTFNGEDFSETGIYVTVLTNALGCDSTDVLNLTVIPASYASMEARICAGETYLFEGDTLSESGVYTVNYTNAAGCDSTTVLTLDVIGTEFSVAQEGQTLTATAEEGASFQWVDCITNELIDGAAENTFTPTVSGSYSAIITLDPCTFVSDCFPVTVVATSDPVQASGWQLSPNPTSGPATLQLDAPATDALNLQVFDMAGRLLLSQTLAAGQTKAAVDLIALPDGVFLVRLSGGGYDAMTQRLVKATK